MYYKQCPLCGAYLDPGEDCDCRNETHRRRKARSMISSTKAKGAKSGGKERFYRL
jgi:hypothetical protein